MEKPEAQFNFRIIGSPKGDMLHIEALNMGADDFAEFRRRLAIIESVIEPAPTAQAQAIGGGE